MEETSVKFTSFLGGREAGERGTGGAGAYCSLLQIGDTNLLLDCGCLTGWGEEEVQRLRREVQAAVQGRLDAVLITHADMAHVGALPYLCGRNGPFPGTPVLCTLPVLKMSYMVLYDYYLRLQSDGTRLKNSVANDDTPGTRALNMLRNSSGLDLTLDDIDDCLSEARMVKFGQRAEVVLNDDSEEYGHFRFLTVCAHSAGRTVGGTSWVIRQGTCEVLYVVDINLRKELTVDGAMIEKLPVSTSLMIVESGHDTSSTVERSGKKEKKEESSLLSSLLSGVMDTVRLEGSVLIPIETVSRTLELLYILGKFWEEKKLGGMYHLVYLSPMAHNVIEYAKSQLEWMPDVLSREFYLGRSNPFSLTHVRMCSSVSEVMALGSGPKVVLATDASLSGGLSKELLLRWGGNPSCRVIFSDRAESATLNSEIRELIATSHLQSNQKGPVIVSVNSAERVLLKETELEEYLKLKDEELRRLEELEHRHLREKELTTLIGGGADGSGKLVDFDADEDIEAGTSDESDDSDYEENKVESDRYEPEDAATALEKKRKRQKKLEENKIKKTKSIGRIAQYATPRFQMFETRELRQLPEYMDEYGLDNSDLTFTEIVTSTMLVPKQGKNQRSQEINVTGKEVNPSLKGPDENPMDLNEDTLDPNAPPTKILDKSSRVQLTCSFKEIPSSAWGRLDFKGVKTLIKKCSPKNLILLHGCNNVTHTSSSVQMRGQNHIKKVIDYASKAVGSAHVFAPDVNQIVHLQIPTDRLRIIVSEHNLVKGHVMPQKNSVQTLGMTMLSIPPSSFGTGVSSTCSIGIVDGELAALSDYDKSIFSNMSLHDGILTTKWVEKDTNDDKGTGDDQDTETQNIEVEIPINDDANKHMEEGDVDDWARQYQERINRAKQEIEDKDGEEPDENDMDVPPNEDGEQFYEEQYDYDTLIDEFDDDSTQQYTGNSDLYASSFVSGRLFDSDPSLANGLKIGSISAGEVQLQNLQQELEAEGVAVEYKLGVAGAGAMLVCGGQVIVKKTSGNDFILEGPPCNAFNIAKSAVYKRFSFL